MAAPGAHGGANGLPRSEWIAERNGTSLIASRAQRARLVRLGRRPRRRRRRRRDFPELDKTMVRVQASGKENRQQCCLFLLLLLLLRLKRDHSEWSCGQTSREQIIILIFLPSLLFLFFVFHPAVCRPHMCHGGATARSAHARAAAHAT